MPIASSSGASAASEVRDAMARINATALYGGQNRDAVAAPHNGVSGDIAHAFFLKRRVGIADLRHAVS